MKKISIQKVEFEHELKDNRVINADFLHTELAQEASMRPHTWDGYIGQEQIKKNLKIFIQAAKNRNECLDHILFFGPPGLGKTTLSHIIAHEMGCAIKVSAAPMIEKSGDLAAILTNLNAGDILFIDEIHRLSPAIEEILYPAMEDYRLDLITGSGPAAQTIKVPLEPFTLIGATTRAGMLSNPLRDRFGMNFRLQFYTSSELAQILLRAAEKLNRTLSQEGANEIARRSRGTPRIALRLLRRVRDYADVNAHKEVNALSSSSAHINLECVCYALSELGVNEHGFDELDLRYLEILVQSRGKPIGLNTIAAAMSEDEATIEDVIEPYLLANGYCERTAKGRIASAKTYTLLGIPYTREQTLF